MNVLEKEYIRLNILEYIQISEYLPHTVTEPILIRGVYALLCPKGIITLFYISDNHITCFFSSFLIEFVMAFRTNIWSLMLRPFLPPTLLSVRFFSIVWYSSLNMSPSRIFLKTDALNTPLYMLKSFFYPLLL